MLAIAALRLGASYVTAVDVDAEALLAAEQNLALNDNLDERVEFLHVREVKRLPLVRLLDLECAWIMYSI